MRALTYLTVFLASVLALSAKPKVSVPNTLDEAFVALDTLLSSEDRISFMHKPEREAVTDAHFSLGMYIRNYWFRHGGSTLPGLLSDAGAQSLDDMSSMVLTSYWRHLHHKPIELKQQGSCYERWWKEQERLEHEAKAKGQDSWRTPDFDCP
jgi:hypothetical protein